MRSTAPGYSISPSATPTSPGSGACWPTCRTKRLTTRLLGDIDSSTTEKLNNKERRAAAEKLAKLLMDIDAGLTPVTRSITDGSLSLTNTFHLADLFVTTASDNELPTKAKNTVERFVHQVFSRPFDVLTQDEAAMSLAYIAALRSSALARRVGAALLGADGSVISIGWNDPVTKGGRCYVAGPSDHREHVEGEDPSDSHRLGAITEFLTAISSKTTWENASLSNLDDDVRPRLEEFASSTQSIPIVTDELVAALSSVPALAGARLMNLIEFGRCVHAEMMAITDAAKRGVSTLGATLYVTTFPCHECARNIIAAGIYRCLFISPYSKSLSAELYAQEGNFPSAPPATSGGNDVDKVDFVPFEGFAPIVTDRLFSWVPRKVGLRDAAAGSSRKPGQAVTWSVSKARLRDTVRGYVGDSDDAVRFHGAALLLAEAELCSRFAFTRG